MSQHKPFALFIDVLGVQDQLSSPDDSTGRSGFDRCRERLESFRKDLSDLITRDLALLSHPEPEPEFVFEFSDSAYIVAERFTSVAIVGQILMQRALRHKYPLRGGIGVGTFSHENSGVRASSERRIWSTSSFLGGAIVSAHRAERSSARGLRIFVHPHVLLRNTEPYVTSMIIPLDNSEISIDSTHELQLWSAREAQLAAERLQAFRTEQQLSIRAEEHYIATAKAYERFGTLSRDSPFLLGPNLWL